ncbi:hypothetical protein ACSSS7_000113 [Eimeria intestinalis]
MEVAPERGFAAEAAAISEPVETGAHESTAFEPLTDGEYRESPLDSAGLKTGTKTGTPKSAWKAAAFRDAEQDWTVYPESNYSFESDSTLGTKWGSGDPEKLFAKRQEAYLREGTRRSVAAVFLVHRAEYPHALLLLDQQRQKYSLVMFKYKTWQRPREVLHDKLSKYLIKSDQGSKRKWVAQLGGDAPEMEVGEFLGEWWRGDFDDELIPYLPPHVTRPKERVRVHQVQLAPRCSFRIPTGFCLTVVPVFDLSPQRVGLAISGLCHLLARFTIRLMVPTTDKYEAVNSLEQEAEPDADLAGPSADSNPISDKSEVAGIAVESEAPDEPEVSLEMLPPELQHLAELEEAT